MLETNNLDKPSAGLEYLRELRGNELRRRADRKSEFRDAYSPYLGLSIAVDNGTLAIHTLVNAAVTGIMEWTDVTDGKDAREAAELLNLPTTVEGGEKDHRADKKKFFSQISGLAIRAFTYDENPKQGAFLLVIGAVQAGRDIEMQRERNIAINEAIPASARDLGKFKTIANSIGNGLQTITPAVPRKYQAQVEKAGNVSLAIGTGLSLAALVDMKLHIRRQRQIQAKITRDQISDIN